MSYIYKITNVINQKSYIGYTSRSLSRRFYEHKREALQEEDREYASYLYNAMEEYSIDNFIIEPIIEFDEAEYDWRDLEQYYIKKYNTMYPNGYNLNEGGSCPPRHYGDTNCKTKVADTDIEKLYEQLRDVSIPLSKIAENFKISVSQVYNINRGESRRRENIDYPIRKYNSQEVTILEIMNILATDDTLSNEKIANLFPNYFRANEIASINNGKKYAYLWKGKFPIRKVTVPNDYEDKQSKSQKVIDYISKQKKTTQRQIQLDLGYSRPVVEKIIRGIYPYRLKNVDYPIQLNK